MATVKTKTVWFCKECGNESPKWMGKCPSCNQWNTMVEDVINTAPEEPVNKRKSLSGSLGTDNHAISYDELEIPDYIRSQTGLDELDRVLGGGLVHGSVVLISGEPGIGKSTLLMQISECLGESRKVLYISGEESSGQLKLRAERLKITGESIYLLTETDTDAVLAECERLKPEVIIIDSIQTMNFTGIIVGLATFFIIGVFHPIVIKAEYYLGTKCWWMFLVAGIAFCALSLVVENLIASTILGVTAFSSYWSILELIHQKRRVDKGWFPEGPGHNK